MVGTGRWPRAVATGRLRFANRVADDVGDGRPEHAVIDVVRVKVEHLEPVPGHPVAEHPQIGIEVYLEVGRELERLRVLRHHGRRVGRQSVVPSRVKAADRVLVDERVENRAGRLVRGHRAGLHAGGTVAEVMVLVERFADGGVGLQNSGVHREHPGAGHGLEVERPVAVPAPFGQPDAEHTVRPLDADAADVEHGGQRVEVEVMVVDPPHRVPPVVVHHQAAADVRQIGVRAVARLPFRVSHQPREPRVSVGAHQVLGHHVLPDHPVGVQVEDVQLRLADLRAVRDAHVDHPQPVAHVYAQPVRVDDPVGGPLAGGRQSVHRVVRIGHQPRRTVLI